jgi:glucosamine--fructose-6-phosphate aminotransferase (isomerizing)
MCGIVGYVGKETGRDPVGMVVHGLRRLEYRGYDSAGLSFFTDSALPETVKVVGKVNLLAEAVKLRNARPSHHTAIGHTRWATHGIPSETNAHPHLDSKRGEIAVVHNGIIENYASVRAELERIGFSFRSSTDTEVIPNLIAHELETGSPTLVDATRNALSKLTGSYAVVVLSSQDPHQLIAARRGSPMLIGVGEGEYLVASDASAIADYTKNILYLEDGELAVLRPDGHEIFRGETRIDKRIEEITWSIEETQRGGFPHYMLKEIHEIPDVVARSLSSRITADHTVVLSEFNRLQAASGPFTRVVICACGTSYFAGLIGKYMIEEIAQLPVEVLYASEFRYHPPVLTPNTLVLAISQSGETADTLEAIRESKRQKAPTAAIVNVLGSTIAREVDEPIYNFAGPEIAVASTKAFVSQLSILSLLAVSLAPVQNASTRRLVEELSTVPKLIKRIMGEKQAVEDTAKHFVEYDNFMFIGRYVNWPTALEGALKLKEISYIHAEGNAAGELKHGPIALIDQRMPTVAIAPAGHVYEKMLSNIEEIRSRHGIVLALATEGDGEITRHVDHVIYVPRISEVLSPLLTVVPLQLFAYYVAVLRGTDVDQPRNLAKSVTVE